MLLIILVTGHGIHLNMAQYRPKHIDARLAHQIQKPLFGPGWRFLSANAKERGVHNGGQIQGVGEQHTRRRVVQNVIR